MAYIQNKNGKFAIGDKEIRLRGFGFGSWLHLEHYMVGMPTPDSMIRESFAQVYGTERAEKFWDDFVFHFMQEEDFELLKGSGVNFLRVPFSYRMLMDDNSDCRWKEKGFAYLNYLLDLCDKFKIYVLLDLHTAPGGQNPDWHSNNCTGIPQFWEFQAFRGQMTRLWEEIAGRFAGREYLFGYDLLNEPAMCKWNALNEFYRDTIEAIRRKDKNHWIVLGGDHFDMDFSGLRRFEDPKICLGFHFYPVCWYPRLSEPDCSREEFNELFRKVLTDILKQCERYDCPCLCGEFGFERITVQDPSIWYIRTEDTVRLFEEHDLSWVIWTYKDMGDMGLACAKRDSGWGELAREIGEFWSQDKEKAEAAGILDLCRRFGYPMSRETEYRLSFRMRAVLYELQAEFVLTRKLKQIPWEDIRKYPEDFALRNCWIDERFLEIMKKYME